MESPPLWVWAIIVGAIIASSSIDGNQQNTLLRKPKKKAEEELILMMINQKTSKTVISMALLTRDIGGHKYSLRRYYKDYFAVKKKKE